ncbi:MerR family transcriptional regulator [Paenibacillus sp. Z3-2]
MRYYDQIGVLKPKMVDSDTGYRYYSADQLLELNRIFIYKELGVTLPQITQLLQEDITLENIQGMFKLKRSEIQQIIDMEQAKLIRIEKLIQLIEEEGQVETYQIKENEAGRELYLPLSQEQDAQFIEIQIPILNR